MTPPTPKRLLALRKNIDAIDDQLVGLLAKRFDMVKSVVEVKRRENLPAAIPSRVEEVIGRVRNQAEILGFPPDSAEKLWRQLIADMIAFEDAALK